MSSHDKVAPTSADSLVGISHPSLKEPPTGTGSHAQLLPSPSVVPSASQATSATAHTIPLREASFNAEPTKDFPIDRKSVV